MVNRIAAWINGPLYRWIWRTSYVCRMVRLTRCTWSEAYTRADMAIDLYSNGRWETIDPRKLAEFNARDYRK